MIAWMLACAHKSDQAYLAAVPAGRSYEANDEAYGGFAREAEGAPAPPPPPPPPPEAAPAQTASPSAEAPARKVFYEAYVHVQSAHPDDTVEAARALAVELGGRVERLYGTLVTLRVPVDRFDEAVQRARTLGDVLSSSISAQDVTAAWLDADLRLRVLRATNDRLAVLLGKSKDEAEKLSIIAEIQRVQEEIDALDARNRTLTSMATLSRLTVEVSPRDAATVDDGLVLAGLEWVAGLSPFDHAVPDGPRVSLPVPDGLVVLDRSGPFRAEGPDGTVLWTASRPNEPVGDGTWWRDAASERIASGFAQAEESTLGAWSCLLLVHDGDAAYRWQFCARDRGRRVDVAQAWFPDAAAYSRHGAAVRAALQGGPS